MVPCLATMTQLDRLSSPVQNARFADSTVPRQPVEDLNRTLPRFATAYGYIDRPSGENAVCVRIRDFGLPGMSDSVRSCDAKTVLAVEISTVHRGQNTSATIGGRWRFDGSFRRETSSEQTTATEQKQVQQPATNERKPSDRSRFDR